MESISIVLPCYNHGKYVAEAIQSVLDQTYKDFNLYVFDNGSEDDSWDEIRAFTDKRIKKIRLKKNDILEVKNQFIKMAKGKYFAIMHADDIWMENKLEKQIKYIQSHNDVRVCVTWANFIEIDDDGNRIDDKSDLCRLTNVPEKLWYRRLFLEGNWISLPSLVCDREIYIKYFGALYPYRQVADVYTWMKILEETNIYVVEEQLVLQRRHNTGKSKNESYPSKTNLYRGDIEARYAKYQIIDEMPDELFLKFFCDEDEDNESCTHLDVMCKKFLFMAKSQMGLVHGYENAVRYYDSYFNYKEDGVVFYQLLADKYDFTREDFFKYEEYLNLDQFVKDIISKESKVMWENIAKLWDNVKKMWPRIANNDVNGLQENIYARFSFPWKLVSPGQKIVIYGGGIVGKAFLGQIANSSYCHVVAVCDKVPRKTGIISVPVITVDALAGMDSSNYDVVVVAIEKRNVAMEICENLRMAGIPEMKIKWIDPQKV